jgi:hypothetical protein
MTIFDVLNSIELEKQPWNELTDEFKKAYSQFMLNRLVSSKKQYLPIVAKLSTQKLTDEQHYMFLCSLINPQKHYFDYKAYKTKKDVNENTIKAVMKEFNVSKRTAKEYLDILGVADAKAITDKWKDYLEVYK